MEALNGLDLFSTNFEVMSLDFFRSPAYRALFDHIDAVGGIYTERWGDAVVRALSLALLQPANAVLKLNISYAHNFLVAL